MILTYAREYGTGGGGMGAIENSLWPTTGDINTETSSLDILIKALGTDIFNANVPASDTWMTFQTTWNAFIADFDQWRDASWFWNLTRRDQLLSYRTQYNNLLAQAKSMGVGTLAQPQADTSSDPFGKLLGTLTTVAIVAGVGVGAYYGVKVWKAAKG